MDLIGYAPDFGLELDGAPMPAELRVLVSAMRCETGVEGVDQAEITLVNDALKLLDDQRLKVATKLGIDLGYAGGPLTRVFTGEIVAKSASFPRDGAPMLRLTAQDKRHRMQQGTRARWFAIPVPSVGNFPLPDLVTAYLVTLEGLMIPVVDPVTAALGVLLGGVAEVATVRDPDSAQQLIRKQAGESNYSFLSRICKENGWDMIVEHDGTLGGEILRFQSSGDRLSADLTFTWGRNLIEFNPRISLVGQIEAVTVSIWVPPIKTVFLVTLGFDWERMMLTLQIFPGAIPIANSPATAAEPHPSHIEVRKSVTLYTAPRMLVGEIIPRLNRRLTAHATMLGEPLLKAGGVVQIEGVGEEFGGRYRLTQVSHLLDEGGFRSEVDLRKEIWFGSIPPVEQGAIPILHRPQVSI
jgi:phage protein D